MLRSLSNCLFQRFNVRVFISSRASPIVYRIEQEKKANCIIFNLFLVEIEERHSFYAF